MPAALLESKTRDYEDAALKLNSPYFSALRKERDIDLIISLDFSEGDPFMVLYAFLKHTLINVKGIDPLEIIIYSPSCHYKPVCHSSVENNRRYFNNRTNHKKQTLTGN